MAESKPGARESGGAAAAVVGAEERVNGGGEEGEEGAYTTRIALTSQSVCSAFVGKPFKRHIRTEAAEAGSPPALLHAATCSVSLVIVKQARLDQQ